MPMLATVHVKDDATNEFEVVLSATEFGLEVDCGD